MSELSSYERRRLAEIETQLSEEPSLAQEAKRFEYGGSRFRRVSWKFWLCLLIGILAPVSTVVVGMTTTPAVGLWVALATTAAFAVAMFCTADRT